MYHYHVQEKHIVCYELLSLKSSYNEYDNNYNITTYW